MHGVLAGSFSSFLTMNEHHIQWNGAKDAWLCFMCLRSSDCLTKEDAERELEPFECLSTSNKPKAALNERRQSVRKRAVVQAELVLRERSVPLRVSTSDLSLGGCYIENMFTLPIGTHLTIALWIGEEKLKISGLVKTCDPVFGNGIQFVDLPPADRVKLQTYLDAVDEI